MPKQNKQTVGPDAVDLDLYGRGYDGIFGPGAEAIGHYERAIGLKKKLDRDTSVRRGEFVERDLYGRGDPRVFGEAAFVGNVPLSNGKGPSRRRRIYPSARV